MNDFISKFKQTSYYRSLFDSADSEVLLVFVGGSRCRNLAHEKSDYDIGIITLNGAVTNCYKELLIDYNGAKIHWYYNPLSWFFSTKCENIFEYTGIFTIEHISDDLILYKNPKYAVLLDEFLNFRPRLLKPACYNVFSFANEYVTDIINKGYIPQECVNRTLYFLCITTYYLFNEPFDTNFLRALNLNKQGVPVSNENLQKALKRIKLAKSYIDQNPIEAQEVLKELYEELEPKIPNPKASAYNYLCKYNFGDDCRVWNPWEGCFKITEACDNCYIKLQNKFENIYYPFTHTDVEPGTFITTCLQSDFFLKEADKYRPAVWRTIKDNPKLIFMIITKRVERIAECLPDDWGDGYDNVVICATVENQKRAEERLPILLSLPIKHRWITCSPMLESIQLSDYLNTGKIEHVEATGERECNGNTCVRPTRYEWIKDLSEQCANSNVRFSMHYLGHNFIMPDGTVKRDWSKWYRSKAADLLDLHNYRPITFNLQDLDITY